MFMIFMSHSFLSILLIAYLIFFRMILHLFVRLLLFCLPVDAHLMNDLVVAAAAAAANRMMIEFLAL